MRREWLICLALIVITLIAFWPAGHLGFILYDDYGKNGYIVDNTNIQAGITFESIRWAFTTTQASNWHPVTWLSHMLDCQLFGLKPSGPHWVNLGFHILNTLLLFVVLREMMGLRRDDPQQPYDSPPRNANKTANAVIAATTPQAQAVWRSAQSTSCICASLRRRGRPERWPSASSAKPHLSKCQTQYSTERVASPGNRLTLGQVMPWATSSTPWNR